MPLTANRLGIELYARLANWSLTLIELLLVLGAAGLAARGARRFGGDTPAQFAAVERAFGGLARQKRLSVTVCGLLPLVVRAALIPLLGIPFPTWHDEFSFLLASDTFAHGRLTNPTHPMWVHFESFHIFHHPTYMSMYPPGQGLVLAAGQVLGHPWIGQLVATAVMCGALCWALQAWLPPQWALLGGLLAVLRIALLSYWMNTYFMGSLAAIGGALVLGAYPRVRRRARWRDALLMAAGVVILANTRPYEGLVFCLPFAAGMAVWLVRGEKFRFRQRALRVALPVLLTLAVAGAGMSYYFWRVTGSALNMPYQVDRAQYAAAPYFVWQKAGPEPEYRHPVMRNFYVGWELHDYKATQSLSGFLAHTAHKALVLWTFYLGPVLTIPLLMMGRVFRDRRMRFPLLVAAVFGAGLLVETWTGSHYAAPATCLLYLLLLQCMRHLRRAQWRQRPVGAQIMRVIPLICLAMIVLRFTAVAAHARIEPVWPRGNLERAEVVQKLTEMPGKQLVIVEYGSGHGSHIEWVFNHADIDAAKIVWARDMGRQNEELIQYFHDRTVWRVWADERPVRMEQVAP